MVARELTFTITDNTRICSAARPEAGRHQVDDKVSVEYVKDGETRTAGRSRFWVTSNNRQENICAL